MNNVRTPHHPILNATLRCAFFGLLLGVPGLVSQTTGASIELEAPNVAHPASGVSTSGQITRGDLESLANAGYAAIINLRQPQEVGNWEAEELAQSKGVAYYSLPLSGGEVGFQAAARLDAILAEIDPSSERPVLIHCASSNRVGALLALRAARHQGLGAEQAIEFGRAAGMRSLEGRVRAQIDNEP